MPGRSRRVLYSSFRHACGGILITFMHIYEYQLGQLGISNGKITVPKGRLLKESTCNETGGQWSRI